MTTFQKVFNGVILGIVVILLFLVLSIQPRAGSVYEQVTKYFYEGLYAGKANQFSVSNAGAVTAASITNTGDSTISGGTLNVTTANTATSTVVAGCWQFYATSTATALKYQASTTPGVMYSQYGSCPNL